MKRRGGMILLSVIVLSIILVNLSLVSAQTNTTSKSVDEKALSCILGKVVSGSSDNCASLSVEEQSFVVMTTGKCVQALTNKGNGDCWPSGSCDLRQTALATIALSSAKGEKWLTSKNITSPDMNWYIQIDTDAESKCSVSYDDRSYNFRISKDKKIDSISGTCLKTARDGYWLQVDRTCIGKTLEFSCNSSFTSNTIYSKKGEEKYYISSDTQSGSENGKIEQTINSYCIGNGGKCDYEGTLWTSLVLEKNRKNVDAYLPYLVAFAEENQRFGSYAFLYLTTGFSEYYSLMQKFQKDSGYFDFSSPYKKYYDTAVAMLSISSSSSTEITKAKDWLSSVQENNGCWSSLRDTAFLLYAGWPSRAISQPSTAGQTTSSCSSKGFFCLSSSECNSAGGTAQDYSCSGVNVCCSKNIPIPTCSARSGSLCASGFTCSGNVVPSSDLGTCCVAGQCIPEQETQTSECESYGYSCLSTCFSDQESKNYECSIGSDICCGSKSSSSSSGSTWWIWVLAILIIVVAALIYWKMKQRSTGGATPINKTRPSSPPPTTPFRRPGMQPMPSTFQRTSSPPPRTSPPATRNTGRDRELDETFKKLKDISK